MERAFKLLDVPTPCFVPPTIAGNMPHLTKDNCEKLSEMKLVGVNFAELFSSLAALEATGMSFANFLQLPNDSQIIFSVTDVLTMPIARNTATHRSLESTNGRKKISPKEYMAAVNTYKPSSFIALADEVDATFGAKRQQSAMDNSLLWLDECLALRQDASSKIFGVLCGGEVPRLRDTSVVETCKRNIDGVVISGFGGTETAEFRHSVLESYHAKVPRHLPRLLLNVGNPLEVLSAVGTGVDAFMSAYPYLVSKFAYALVFWIDDADATTMEEMHMATKINLRDKSYDRDLRPLLPGCTCFACSNHSRAYINHLLNVHEMLANVLLYMHNLHHYFEFFRAIRRHIGRGTFAAYHKAFEAHYSAN
ncbi:Aste57867_25350 [Aphanomyces stellatus]|uniref:Queuine tRNA-ribosyltransferase accessory subunit 2 n=1 Tax=Aphanomyces stellatus TaxID=120398 RepID=A0A485LSY7_9STRA|nr:hypothetical protein As57867_025272 [Aphanomyces stellatus]VFU01975.1 Aste57867_25350 [Aphanomyces stellatus]